MEATAGMDYTVLCLKSDECLEVDGATRTAPARDGRVIRGAPVWTNAFAKNSSHWMRYRRSPERS